MIRHRVVENTFARAYPPADGEGGGIGDGAYGRPYFRDDNAAAAPKSSDQSLRERARLLDTIRLIDQLKELGTLDPGQLRDLSQWLQAGGGSGIERNAFWQGVLGNPFDPFGDLGIADQQRGLDAVRARNQRPGYDWQDEGRARGDEARAGLGLGRWGLVADEGDGHTMNRDSAIRERMAEDRLARARGQEMRQERRAMEGDRGRDPDATGSPDAGATEVPDAGTDAGGRYLTPAESDDDHDGVINWFDFNLDLDAGPPGDAGPAGRDQGEEGGPLDYTGLTARLLGRLPVNWSPRPLGGGGARVLPGRGPDGPVDHTHPAPRLVVGGLADEPLRRRRYPTRMRAFEEAVARILGTVDPPKPDR